MGMSITTITDKGYVWGQPRPMKMILVCDCEHASPVSRTFTGASLDDWMAAAHEAGWQILRREGVEVRCPQHRADWGGRGERAKEKQLTLF